ncbi:MAG: ZIP family metal transporter [Rhodothermales bacterium]
MAPDVSTVFIYALITALATGLGALPLFFARHVPRSWLGLANAIAAGLMLAVSFNLIYEGFAYNKIRVLLGMTLGLVFIVLSRNFLNRRGEIEIRQLRSADPLRALLIVGVMTIHSFAEGIGVGVSFGGGETFGIFISLAIAVHNIPEGLAISLVLVPDGVSVWRAGVWSIISSLPQPLMAVPAFIFVSAFEPVLPVGLGFASGAMIWMVFSEIVPEALEESDASPVAVVLTLAVIVMTAVQILIGG